MSSTSLKEDFIKLLKVDDLDKIKGFIEREVGKDPQAADDNNQNLLFYLVTICEKEEKCLKLMKYIVSQGVDPEIIDMFGQTILFYTAAAGFLECTKWLNENYKFDLFQTDDNGETPLFYAVRYGRYNIVEYLVSQNYDFNLLNKEGENCLFKITDDAHWKIAEFLRKKGINLNVIGENKITFLDYAEKVGMFKVAKALKGEEVKEDQELSENKKELITLMNKSTGKPLTYEEVEEFKNKYPEIYKLLIDNEKKENVEKKKEESDSEESIYDINN